MKQLIWLSALIVSCNGGSDGGKVSSDDGNHPSENTSDETPVSTDTAQHADTDSNTTASDGTEPDTSSSNVVNETSDGSEPTDSADDQESDTGIVADCPNGNIAYTTKGGKTVCCNKTYPVFCDENEAGYDGGCWGEGVDCDTLILCGGQPGACLVGALSYCNDDDSLSCYSCPSESIRYETKSGRPVCCSPTRAKFCDETTDGYPGGCWSDEVDCNTISVCDGSFTACFEGNLPYCSEAGEFSCYPCPEGAVQHETSTGRPFCCPEDKPVFCDENSSGYTGGCWTENVDCETVLFCGGFWGACVTGRESFCEADTLRCLVP